MDQDQAREIARKLHGWVSCACMDMADGDEAAADDMYNDVDMLQDLLGDRIIDEARGNRETFCLITQQLVEVSPSTSIKKAAQALLRTHS